MQSKLVGGLVAALLLCACASQRWVKPGATQDDFARDKWNCALMAKQLNENNTWSRGYTQNKLFSECMADHGWSTQQ